METDLERDIRIKNEARITGRENRHVWQCSHCGWATDPKDGPPGFVASRCNCGHSPLRYTFYESGVEDEEVAAILANTRERAAKRRAESGVKFCEDPFVAARRRR